jgi:serine/threonine protein kinase
MNNAKYKIICNLCEGLVAMHNMGVAHRDIKLENIMVNPKTNEIKYIDFGLANIDTETTQSDTRVIMQSSGTIPYMDPKLLTNIKALMMSGIKTIPIDELQKSDIFSLASTIYELLNGSRGPCADCVTNAEVVAKCQGANVIRFNRNFHLRGRDHDITLFNVLRPDSINRVKCPRKADNGQTQFSQTIKMNHKMTVIAKSEGRIFGYLPDMWIHKKLHYPTDPLIREDDIDV